MSKTIAKCWTFSSSSSDATYQTLQYSDGSTSCECPGWTRRVAPDGSRSCKHTRSVDQGRADIEAESFHDYTKPTTTKPQTKTTHATKENKNQSAERQLGERKFHLE